MTVTSAVGGNIYLKGTAYADYRDNIWSIISDNDAARYPQDFVPFTATIGNNALTDTRVHMLNKSKIAYVPYFLESLPDNLNSVADVCVKNNTDKNEFNYSHYPFYAENTYRYNNSAEAENYKAFVYDTYLEIPRKTQIELRRIADQEGFLDSELTVSEKIEMVKNYISDSKTYSLKTPKMPSGKDFATWFLNESDTGYCVHFATAGTLMLRALGIPARYVTGYYATAYANQTVTVTTDNAHAWLSITAIRRVGFRLNVHRHRFSRQGMSALKEQAAAVRTQLSQQPLNRQQHRLLRQTARFLTAQNRKMTVNLHLNLTNLQSL